MVLQLEDIRTMEEGGESVACRVTRALKTVSTRSAGLAEEAAAARQFGSQVFIIW